MFVKRDGSGPRIYFGLHGWSGDHATFSPLLRYLPDDSSFLSVDLPGYGHSPAPDDWSLSELANRVADEIVKLNAASITVVGNCSGALLGLSAISQLKSEGLGTGPVSRLVLIDPFAYAPLYFRIFVSTFFGEYAYYSTFANPIGRWITNLSLKSRRTEETDLTASFRAIDHRVSYRYLKILTAIDGIKDWGWIRTPVDIVYGERTFAAIKRSIPMWREIWPQARAFELEGAGHLPIQEATEAMSRIIFQEHH